MTFYKFDSSHWLKLQNSDCREYFNQWDHLNYNRSWLILKSYRRQPPNSFVFFCINDSIFLSSSKLESFSVLYLHIINSLLLIKSRCKLFLATPFPSLVHFYFSLPTRIIGTEWKSGRIPKHSTHFFISLFVHLFLM